MQLLAGAVAAVLTAALIWLLLCTGLAWKVLDRPNSRSLHTTATPRVGGICVVIAIVTVALWFDTRVLWPIIITAAGLSALSLADDIWCLPPALRFAFHIAAAGFILMFYPPVSWLLLVLLVLAVVWMTNLYNFMDGLDGLAGGMTLFGFGAFAIAAAIGGSVPLSVLSATIVGSAAGFLVFNIHPARIFLGDAGAIPLGLLAAALGYFGFREAVWSWWFPLLVFSPFIVDATATLIRRLLAGEKVWQAHCTHYYQRMAQSGLGHFGTALRWYLLMGVVAASAIFLRHASPFEITIGVIVWLVFYAVAMFWIDRQHIAAGHNGARDV